MTIRRRGLGAWDREKADVSCTSPVRAEHQFALKMECKGLMEEVVDGVSGGPGYAHAELADLEAIAAYIASIPAIRHEPGAGD